MNKYHVILRDELGEEFSVECLAINAHDALDKVGSEYPESGIVSYRVLQPYLRED